MASVHPAVIEAEEAVHSAALRLAAAGARDEVLAEYLPARRRLGIPRPPAMRVLGRVWRLGVLLLTPAGDLRTTAETLRIVDPGQRSTPSRLAELRREQRRAARRAGIADGATVNFDTRPIDVDADALAAAGGPIILRGDRLLVRWNAGSDAQVPFGDYLDERVALLIRPPEGS